MDMTAMFSVCSKLKSLDLSSFDTRNVTSMSCMFLNCRKLTSLNLSGFNTAKVTAMNLMFNNCTMLPVLDLASFDTSNVTDMDFMFSLCTNLKTIYVGDGWNTDNVTSDWSLFGDCKSLVGGAGTTYSLENPQDKTYAHIDGVGGPGYLTAKSSVGISTDIDDSLRDSVKGQRDGWYTIDGRKLNGKPTKKGVYINNGKAVVR